MWWYGSLLLGDCGGQQHHVQHVEGVVHGAREIPCRPRPILRVMDNAFILLCMKRNYVWVPMMSRCGEWEA